MLTDRNKRTNVVNFLSGASGNWIIEQAGPAAPMGFQPRGGFSTQCWVPASSGQVPPSSFAGGEDDGEPLYVIRANFNGGLIPGKLKSSHGCAYIPWGGAENAVNDYEVLCDFNGQWLAASGGNIPPNAVTAGQSEDGEPLYVGRVVHDGYLVVGKVQPSHGVLYIPFGGQELSFGDYEILVQ